ncbi:helix-turn-helix domain-containing protein [Streptomyces sp. NBC_01803]|uniref:helix-turn-helix domain-containing protein n=1 Tax=Streptomyces sp. NBC_01803 TaxID=2975946 RepID=UPI002DD8283E|nr:helix-turn-helix domain-containing protein [Streptomyces sp. NBC_01803]WSA44802.1 helix-turn-helix domain-containing protein [Streptomyces sp. NBC_01803]
MVERGFHSDDLPRSERFDYCHGRYRGVFELTSDHADHFFACERFLPMGAVQLGTKSYLPMDLTRVSRSESAPVPDTYELVFPVQGVVHTAFTHGDFSTSPGGLYVHDISRVRSVSFRTHDEARPYHEIGLSVPKSLLTLPTDKVDRLLGERLPVDSGFGAMLTMFIRQLTTDSASFGPDDGPRLGTVAVDLVAALFGSLLAAESALPPESRSRALTLRIRAFIKRHLTSADLTPQAIADAHHISVSYLHKLFRTEDTTVAAFIRHERLERARHALTDRALRGTPIHTIATHWGFANSADFSRAFRAAYGVPPRDYRQHALGSDG